MTKNTKPSKHEIFLKKLKKIPVEARPWDILKNEANLQIAKQVGKSANKNLRAGETEEIWNRLAFEREILDWFKTKPVPEFLFS